MIHLSYIKSYMHFNPIFKNQTSYFRRGLIRAVKNNWLEDIEEKCLNLVWKGVGNG
ncbi:hypothetical protein C823_004013 [Eubacterium plexicaudatum ASF492]|uniref:Uncharacterized protein n=1 Tax=Eubacterium plexicaudatum ASF492 TaxID=1235802 RepID=N1ZX54_9FIRM|nr:hypothetical protein C823_004013 [Eubacterium plexicaudatum ASF492]